MFNGGGGQMVSQVSVETFFVRLVLKSCYYELHAWNNIPYPTHPNLSTVKPGDLKTKHIEVQMSNISPIFWLINCSNNKLLFSMIYAVKISVI